MHERISIVIPTYKENAYLGRTLENLRQQTVIDQAEIILADFNPDASTWYKAYLGPNVRYVGVDRKGIAYGRHKGIEASKGEVIVNFDADARYDTANALSYMTEPILANRCVLTCCDNIFDLQGLSAKELEAM